MSSNSSVDIISASYWHEYQMLNSLMLRYLEAASQVQIYAVILLGGLIPLIQYIDQAVQNKGDPYILYLFAALVFCALGFYQIHLDNQVAEIDNYLLAYLAPRVRNFIDVLGIHEKQGELISKLSEEILGYHLYWRRIRYNKFIGIWLSFGALGRTGVAVLSTTGLFTTHIYYEYFFNPTPPSLSFIRILFICIIAFGIIWMLFSSIIVRFRYSIATNNYMKKFPKIDYLPNKEKPEETHHKSNKSKPKKL